MIKNGLSRQKTEAGTLSQPNYSGVGQKTRDLIDASKKDDTKVYLLQREKYQDIYLWKGDRILFYKDKMKIINGSLVTAELVKNIWLDMNYQGIAKEGNVVFPKSKKPESQIRRILQMSTNKNDLVLDSFLGSGTTSAVAHKMNRRWIGVELGDHCYTHCIPRLKQVCDGTDQGGISKKVNWQGGGGFKFYELAPSLLKKDKYDNWVIDECYNADMLAASMSKHEGFKYYPNPEIYWKQGQSTEKDYIFTTTQFVTADLIDTIHDEMKDDESLLICCKSFQKVCETKYPNITVKKIPNMLLGRCEFGKKDYSLNIIDMPGDEDAPEFVPVGPPKENIKKQKKVKKKDKNQPELF
ncbi:site-specific DNA-methyltransferase [Candidatus Dependentiae bacterium]|nr:site-specific DNA-methyltransferase [Candidatus Dependentiae bacterium]